MTIQELQQQADIYLQQEDFTIAINLYEQCIELAPEKIYLYWYLGLSWLLQGDEEQCQMTWLLSFANIDLEQENVVLIEFINFLKNQAQKYFDDQKFEIAQKIFTTILEWDNNQAEVYYQLGHTIANQGDLEAAISCWQNVIQIQPDYLEAYLYQGYIWHKLGKFNKAIENYQNTIALQEDYFYYYQLGLCYSYIKEWELAKDCFLQVIKIQNDYAPAYSDLGFVFLHKGDFQSAVNYFQQAINLQPDFCQALIFFSETVIPNDIELIKSLNNSRLEIQEIYLLIHKLIVNIYPEISLRLLENILANEPNDLPAYLEISNLLLNQNQPTAAITILRKIPDDEREEIYFILGKCWLKLGDYQKAIDDLRKAIEINSHLTEAYHFLGIALFRNGNFLEAVNVLKQQLKLEPKSPSALAYLGFILGNNNQNKEAIFYFQKAIEINSSVTSLVNELLTNLSEFGGFDLSQIPLVLTPRNFHESTQEWLDNNDLFSIENYINIYPEIDVKLTYPKSINNQIHYSFRFGNLVKLPSSYVVKIPQGRFWLSSDQTESAIMTDESHFLADISPYFPILSPNHPDKHPSQHPILAMQKLPPIHFIEGKVAILAGLTNHVYFHWMLDVLPRWELLRISNYDFADIDYFVVDNQLTFQKETLMKLQIPEEKQLNIREIQHLQATELIVPSFPGCVAWMPSWTCSFLKQQFLSSEISENVKITKSKKRIYLTRKLAKSRRIINEDEILNLLKFYGFETVTLESMSVVEQALLFSEAEIIISPHGSGLTNLVFCQPGTKVIELFSPNYVYHCYWWISNLVSLDYYYLIGETLLGWYLHHFIYPQEFAEDIFIKIDDFEKILQVANVNLK
ncbi:tetratricopeptide repeat protein [Nodularia harveyana UHCC-0300]|uniref:Tetratricopeptide repeat protein n=1 Tax=Nodularia harveyana UHCC-0300 TaxID=2974287 RepID=A0ABU5UAK3_9CYAN|nr:tetratricopeptide repeat protein [Nodularia harveyana]MEA5580555.1 tetratricopeptide repeat protein [Nodularia harveyana UHCC-0300]